MKRVFFVTTTEKTNEPAADRNAIHPTADGIPNPSRIGSALRKSHTMPAKKMRRKDVMAIGTMLVRFLKPIANPMREGTAIPAGIATTAAEWIFVAAK